MNKVWAWLVARLGEKSTWGGLVAAIGTVAGIAIVPEKAEAIATLGTFVASLIAVATREG